MPIKTSYQEFEISIFSDILYSPNSADNLKSYEYLYSDKAYDDYLYVTRHGVEVYRDDDLISSCLLISDGGTTGIHERGFLIERDYLLVCCAHSIFCLRLPDLSLVWRTTADMMTCFEIYKFEHDFIIHGELEITRIDCNGNIVWKFMGDEIFTTPSGKNDFKIVDEVIYTTNWDGRTFQLNANTGILIN